MPKDGNITRNRILDKARELIINQGFTGTSIDSLIEMVGITKGAFFYHFKSKSDLAMALVEKHAVDERQLLQESMNRAERLSHDPLQQLLIFVGLVEEKVLEMTEANMGCLYASYCYQKQLFDDKVMDVCESGILEWRKYLLDKIDQIIEKHPPCREVNSESLADVMLSILEGAFVLSKTLNDPKVISQQLNHFKFYMELLFSSAKVPVPRLENQN